MRCDHDNGRFCDHRWWNYRNQRGLSIGRRGFRVILLEKRYLGPLAGETIADLATGDPQCPIDPHLFRFERFAENDLIRASTATASLAGVCNPSSFALALAGFTTPTWLATSGAFRYSEAT